MEEQETPSPLPHVALAFIGTNRWEEGNDGSTEKGAKRESVPDEQETDNGVQAECGELG